MNIFTVWIILNNHEVLLSEKKTILYSLNLYISLLLNMIRLNNVNDLFILSAIVTPRPQKNYISRN